MLFPLGEPEDSEIVKVELGGAADFVTYIESENILKVQNVGSRNFGDHSV